MSAHVQLIFLDYRRLPPPLPFPLTSLFKTITRIPRSFVLHTFHILYTLADMKRDTNTGSRIADGRQVNVDVSVALLRAPYSSTYRFGLTLIVGMECVHSSDRTFTVHTALP